MLSLTCCSDFRDRGGRLSSNKRFCSSSSSIFLLSASGMMESQDLSIKVITKYETLSYSDIKDLNWEPSVHTRTFATQVIAVCTNSQSLYPTLSCQQSYLLPQSLFLVFFLFPHPPCCQS